MNFLENMLTFLVMSLMFHVVDGNGLLEGLPAVSRALDVCDCMCFEEEQLPAYPPAEVASIPAVRLDSMISMAQSDRHDENLLSYFIWLIVIYTQIIDLTMVGDAVNYCLSVTMVQSDQSDLQTTVYALMKAWDMIVPCNCICAADMQ
ncbi:unnamed protein product [Hermetia illucens]|uniref:Uncharacterized protein n=1 Tax=Hermetia illucens TaxID=343691 RepID=A0A7R8Z1P4_HERIL|nr:unnamed protein product [Hermetia illucens]